MNEHKRYYALEAGQWVWSKGGGYHGDAGKPQWVQIIDSVGSEDYPRLRLCLWSDGQELNLFEHEIDLTKGVHDERPDHAEREADAVESAAMKMEDR